MAHNYIIQWNCRGLRSNREDIEWLISKYAPAAICLQETMLKPEHTPTFKHYSAYYKSNIQGHGGVCILVEVVAVCITINHKTYTVASVYVPTSGTLNELAFDRMIKSFSSRYLVLGDFNGHSYLWGANQENERILLDIINETWKSDTFPESWREALIISIPKPGKDHFNPLNYRPIALTSCICKTVERMANERLVWYLEKNGLLAKQQCGYRANRSTVDHLIRLETFIRDAFIQNQHLVAVFFDLQKAYDTTWKHGILKDLHDMGLRGNLPIFIGNFLSDRTFQVHLGTILSDVFHQEEGVPQGAILSTTLFNVEINNIVKQFDPGVECSLYVDDFVIMY